MALFLDTMESGDTEELAYWFRIIMSFLRGDIEDSELPYEAFVVGLVAASRGRYEVHIGSDSYEGRPTLYMIPVSEQGVNIVMGIVHRRKENRDRTREELAGEALERIRDKGWDYGLRGETILYGVAFERWKSTVVMERVGGSRPRRPTDSGNSYGSAVRTCVRSLNMSTYTVSYVPNGLWYPSGTAVPVTVR